jgi:hypothetical protein
MTTLSTKTPGATFRSILTVNVPVSGSAVGLDSTLRSVEDGAGHQSPLSLSQSQIAFSNLVWPAVTGNTNDLLRISATTGLLEWHTLSSLDITTALGFTPASATSSVFTTPLVVKSATLDTQVTTVNTTNATPVYTFANTAGGTIKLLCQVQDTSSNAFHSEELMIVSDGSTLDLTGFAVVVTQNVLGVFDAIMSSGQVVLTFTASAATTKTVKVVAISVTA